LTDKLLVWASERPERDSFQVGDGIELATIPRPIAAHADLTRVGMLIPPFGSRAVLEALPAMTSLRLVQTLESGVDWLLPAVPDHVTLCNSKGAHDAAVAEWIVAVVLAMQRRLPDHLHAQRERTWRDIVAGDEWQPPYSGDLEDSAILIVGYGSIGEATEKRLKPFEVAVSRVARRRRSGVHPVSDLDRLIPSADIVILLLPLTPSTMGLIDADLMGKMKPGALLVNAGRGGVVDQDALLDLLREGRLRAALDVTDPEPLPSHDPLWTAPNILLTPHMAGDTPRRFRRSWRLAAEQAERLRNGHPLANVVSRS
jgi:phosphoglycerate dehydrogenase-like enzyme